eukprot:scaffold95917_cov31-Tisochrysis_lutea.AAC.4
MLTALSSEELRGTAIPPTRYHSLCSPVALTVLTATVYSGAPELFSASKSAPAFFASGERSGGGAAIGCLRLAFFLGGGGGGVVFLPNPLAIITVCICERCAIGDNGGTKPSSEKTARAARGAIGTGGASRGRGAGRRGGESEWGGDS